MIGAAIIQRLPQISLKERCILFEIAEHEGRELTPRRAEALLGRVCPEAWDAHRLYDDVAREIEWLVDRGGGIVTITQNEYPRLLREIYDPPFALYFRGTLPAADSPFAAVVGTRRPNGRGSRTAYALGKDFGEASISVVSGLARGIDRQAHEGNIAGGGKTVAVLGSGIAEVGPISSRPTAERLLSAQGALVSEYPVFDTPRRYYFPKRNRIISGMSRCCVVVQAPKRSGALITADYALEQGRDVFVHASCLQPGAGEGGRAMAEEGARLISSVDEVTEGWETQWGAAV